MRGHHDVVPLVLARDEVSSAAIPAGTPTVVGDLSKRADDACELLKSMAHEGRLVILFLLAQREHSVTELETTLALRQPAVSQQLARLRADRLVTTRRDGKMIYYSLASTEARTIIDVLCGLYAS